MRYWGESSDLILSVPPLAPQIHRGSAEDMHPLSFSFQSCSSRVICTTVEREYTNSHLFVLPPLVEIWHRRCHSCSAWGQASVKDSLDLIPSVLPSNAIGTTTPAPSVKFDLCICLYAEMCLKGGVEIVFTQLNHNGSTMSPEMANLMWSSTFLLVGCHVKIIALSNVGVFWLHVKIKLTAATVDDVHLQCSDLTPSSEEKIFIFDITVVLFKMDARYGPWFGEDESIALG